MPVSPFTSSALSHSITTSLVALRLLIMLRSFAALVLREMSTIVAVVIFLGKLRVVICPYGVSKEHTRPKPALIHRYRRTKQEIDSSVAAFGSRAANNNRPQPPSI